MNRDEAKLLLQVYRPGGQDAAEPRFAEALNLAKNDPELAAWFEQEQAFDAAISQSVKGVPIPENLKSAILTGGKVLNLLPWWRLINWREVAICVSVLLVGAGFFLFSLGRTQNILTASRAMIQFSDYRVANLAVKSDDLDHLRAFFTKCHAPANFEIPGGLSRLPVVGGTLIGLQDRTASLVCFQILGNNQLRLFVTELIEAPEIPPPGSIRIYEFEDWSWAIWTANDMTYVVAGRVHPASLERLLKMRRLTRTAITNFDRQILPLGWAG